MPCAILQTMVIGCTLWIILHLLFIYCLLFLDICTIMPGIFPWMCKTSMHPFKIQFHMPVIFWAPTLCAQEQFEKEGLGGVGVIIVDIPWYVMISDKLVLEFVINTVFLWNSLNIASHGDIACCIFATLLELGWN